ncbi:MAG: aspartate/glutamate racemase family protein [Pseudomonadota bacterium]
MSMTNRKKTYYGVTLGILMVDSMFTRFPGDIGNALTWPFPVQYKVVRGASPAEMISLEASDVLQPFKDAADELIEDGVDGITTTCGFLALFQKELAEHCPVPVCTSALLQVPLVERLIPAGQRAGILTYSAESLKPPHLEAAGVALDTPVAGIPRDSAFFRWIMEGQTDTPIEAIRDDAVSAAEALVRDNPEVGAIVSECTNLTPFAADIQAATGLPVFDMVSMVTWFQMGLKPRRFDA